MHTSKSIDKTVLENGSNVIHYEPNSSMRVPTQLGDMAVRIVRQRNDTSHESASRMRTLTSGSGV